MSAPLLRVSVPVPSTLDAPALPTVAVALFRMSELMVVAALMPVTDVSVTFTLSRALAPLVMVEA